jgi:hypothetical protein
MSPPAWVQSCKLAAVSRERRECFWCLGELGLETEDRTRDARVNLSFDEPDFGQDSEECGMELT